MQADALIIRDLPQHIETERLVMRLPQYGDGRVVAAGIEASKAELMRFMDWLGEEGQGVDDTERYLRGMMANFIMRTDYVFLLFERDSGRYAGSCGAHIRNWQVSEYEIGYWLVTGMTGRGYMTEAVKGLSAYLFEHTGAERIMIRCDARNTGSANVALRCGYTAEGTFRDKERARDGTLRTMRYFSKLRGE